MRRPPPSRQDEAPSHIGESRGSPNRLLDRIATSRPNSNGAILEIAYRRFVPCPRGRGSGLKFRLGRWRLQAGNASESPSIQHRSGARRPGRMFSGAHAQRSKVRAAPRRANVGLAVHSSTDSRSPVTRYLIERPPWNQQSHRRLGRRLRPVGGLVRDAPKSPALGVARPWEPAGPGRFAASGAGSPRTVRRLRHGGPRVAVAMRDLRPGVRRTRRLRCRADGGFGPEGFDVVAPLQPRSVDSGPPRPRLVRSEPPVTLAQRLAATPPPVSQFPATAPESHAPIQAAEVLATGVYFGGTARLVVGSRYAIVRHGSILRLMGPLDSDPSVVAVECSLDRMTATVIQDRLVVSDSEGGGLSFAIGSLAGATGRQLEDSLAAGGPDTERVAR